jgi:glutamate-ammonia-ligase adenylyltransferase
VADDLGAAYRHLRHVEHRLQMMEDQQTQTLPQVGSTLDVLAKFCGHKDTNDFELTLLEHMAKGRRPLRGALRRGADLGGPSNLVFTGTEDDPGTVQSLQQMGFPTAAGLRPGARLASRPLPRHPQCRARETADRADAEAAGEAVAHRRPRHRVQRFDSFMRSLPAGVQLFSLLYSNPELLDLIADVMGSAPLLADHLSRYPMLLDGVLTAGFFEKVPDRPPCRAICTGSSLRRRLPGPPQPDVPLDQGPAVPDRRAPAARRRRRQHRGGELSDVADAVIGELYPAVAKEFEQAHGRLPGRGMCVVALGKLGSREMTVTSDLDLIFMYDIPADVEDWDTMRSDGRKPLAPIQYYARLRSA